MRRALAMLIASCCFVSAARAQTRPSTIQPPSGAPTSRTAPRDPSQPNVGTATLRGRVTAADSGQPLRKAQVRAMAGDIRENRLATTDENGRYEFKDLPAGRYNISANKGSYVGISYGQTQSTEPGKPLEILDGQTVEKVDFVLPVGGVITGRIVDEFGDPLSDVQVAPMRYLNMNGRRQLMNAGRMASTNDIGEFRLFGIPPGQYYLSATLRNMGSPVAAPDGDDVHAGYAQTFFPSTINAAEAQRLTIRVGQTIPDLTLVLVPTRLARVSGTVSDSQGRPMMGAVMAVPKENFTGMFGPPGPVRPDGSFVINGVAAGTYALQWNGSGGGDAETASAEVTVNGEDVENVRLVGSKPVTAAGRIVVDPAALQSVRASAFRVVATPAPTGRTSFGPNPNQGPGVVNDDLSFEVKVRPGRMRITVINSPPGWTVRAVRYRGVDVTDAGMDFSANQNVSDIEIELTNRVTTVIGTVSNGRSDASKDYSVLVFVQDRDRWTQGSRYIRSGRPDQDGRFKVSGLPPGDYCAIALDVLDFTNVTDPDLLERVRPRATTFSLVDGETKTLDLRLNAAASLQ